MKKLSTLLAACAVSLTLSAQQTDDGKVHLSGSAASPSSPSVQSFSCDSVGTTLAAGNGNDGIMFDVTAVQNVRVTYVDIKITTPGPAKMLVYYKSGSHVGSENTPGAWTLLDTANVTATSGFTHLPIYINQVLTSGSTLGLYVTSDGINQIDYTNGTAVGNVFSQDANLQVKEGTGIDFPFGGTFTPRVPNVTVSYCDVNSIPSCLTDTTTFTSNNGNDGNMFDVTIGSSDVTLRRMHCNVNGMGWWYIYYRVGTYVGNESSAAGWILIDSAYVTSAGMDQPTLIPVDMDIYAPAGSTIAFYTTGNGTGADINYTDGTTEGAVYSSTPDISIKEGKGMTYPFGGLFTPRVWNGILEYCVGPTGVSQQISTIPGWSAMVMPNPASTQAQLMITSPTVMENGTVRIVDMNGREVANVGGVNGNVVSLPIETLSSGVYYCMVQNAEGNIVCTTRFIRQ